MISTAAGAHSRGSGRPYRAPAGLPQDRNNWRVGTAVSVLLHLVLLILIVAPFAASRELSRIEQGAGGAGPAGGGGGGTRGTGPRDEAIQYVRIASPPAPTPAPVIPPVTPPVIETPPVPKPVAEVQLPDLALLKAPTIAVTGSGGTGNDNTSGSGPGSGGGIGTGTGTGRGSGVGPGTGGGTQQNFPPSPTELLLPPHPVPGSVRGHRLIAQFDIDETGKVLSVSFNETRDRGYNRRLTETLRAYRFKPGHTPDGRPIRMKFQMELDLY